MAFVFSFAELSSSIPDKRAPLLMRTAPLDLWGVGSGYGSLVEFLLSTPPIAMALGSYVHFLFGIIVIVFLIFDPKACL